MTKISEIAARHGFSAVAVREMLDAVIAGNGSMAQFSHPEFGGAGQWMRGGMTMVSDMFNHRLAARVDSLAAELAEVSLSSHDASSLFEEDADSERNWWPAELGTPTAPAGRMRLLTPTSAESTGSRSTRAARSASTTRWVRKLRECRSSSRPVGRSCSPPLPVLSTFPRSRCFERRVHAAPRRNHSCMQIN